MFNSKLLKSSLAGLCLVVLINSIPRGTDTSLVLIFWGSIFLIVGLLLYLALPVLKRKLNWLDLKIWWELRRLRAGAKKNASAIESLKANVLALRERMDSPIEVSDSVTEVLVENISLWEQQINLHGRIIRIYEDCKNRVVQHREEISLLRFAAGRVKKDPDIERLTQQIATHKERLDNFIRFKLINKIQDLTDEIHNMGRKEKLTGVGLRLNEIESQVFI